MHSKLLLLPAISHLCSNGRIVGGQDRLCNHNLLTDSGFRHCCACSCQGLSNRCSFGLWSTRCRTPEQCMAHVAFSCCYLGPLSHSQTLNQQQPLPWHKQVAAPRTSGGKALRLQAHAYTNQRAASKAQSPYNAVRNGLQAVKGPQRSPCVCCFAQSCPEDSQVPGKSHDSTPPSSTAAQVHHALILHLDDLHHAPERL